MFPARVSCHSVAVSDRQSRTMSRSTWARPVAEEMTIGKKLMKSAKARRDWLPMPRGVEGEAPGAALPASGNAQS